MKMRLFSGLLAVGALLVLGCGGTPQEAFDPYADVYRDGGGGVAQEVPTADLSSVRLVGEAERSAMSTLVAQAVIEDVREDEGTAGGGGAAAGGGGGTTPAVPRIGATAVPSPVATAQPVVRAIVGVPTVPVVTATPVVGQARVVFERRPCVEDFREFIARDRGLVGRWFEMDGLELGQLVGQRSGEFDVDYVADLNEEFVTGRPDCVEDGWAPEFSYSSGCSGERFAGGDATAGSYFGEFPDGNSSRPRWGEFVWNSTRQEERKVLIQFDRLPFRDAPGCWDGNIILGTWRWQVEGGSEYGFDYRVPRVCNGTLLLLAEMMRLEGWSTPDWVLESGRYLRESQEDCPVNRLEPVVEADPACAVQSDTGPTEEGGLVLHWQNYGLFRGQPVCWVGSVDPDSGGVIWIGYDTEGERASIGVPGV